MKRMMSICFLTVCSCLTLFAQIDPLFLQQANNRVTINPAATGKGGDINASLGLRQQWIGFSGPATRILNASGFVKEIRSGFGLTWMGDQFGPQRTQNLKVNYAYFIPFEDRAFLSLGLGMGILNNVYDETEFFAMDDNDDAITYIKDSKIIPDFDFGIEFNMRNFEIGASVAHLTYSNEEEALLHPVRNIYAYTRIKVPMDRYWDFIPGITWHNVRNLNTCEINTAFRYNNNVCVNLIYRLPKTVGIALGINVYKGLRFAYSYDYGMDAWSSYNKGSHEILVSYNVPINATYVRSKLRFFQWKMF